MVDESKSKCGEIFRIDNGSYIFICFHCGAEFKSSADIVEHIEKHFLLNPLPFAAAFNFTVNVKLEDESKEFNDTIFSPLVVPKIEVDLDAEHRNENDTHQHRDDESDHWPGDIFDLAEKGHKIKANKSTPKERVEPQPVKLKKSKLKQKKRIKSPPSSTQNNHRKRNKRKTVFICETCGKQFKYKSQIREHVTIHANISLPPQLYECDVCSATFSKKFSLRTHLHRHLPEDFHKTEPMKCKYCGKQFSFYNKYTKHVAAHETVKTHKCSICYNRFVTAKNLERHQKQHEANKFPKSICSQCGKSFPNKSVLTKHFRIHTGERPYACKVCHKTYNTSSYLIIHMRSHTGERPYQCTLCGRTYVAANKLNEHMKWHNNVRPYKCNQCSKTFLLLENLKRHEPKHNQVRPVCNICNKSFSMDRTYRQHMQLHEGIGKYKCRHCDDSFSSSVSRQNHEYNLHPYNSLLGQQFQAEESAEINASSVID